jgi:hypothetical protein
MRSVSTIRSSTAGCTFSPASPGSVCSITSISCRPPAWPTPPRTRAAWAALLTWLTGAYYLETGAGYGHGVLLQAFTFRPGYEIIGLGAWFGTIMLFNVWVLIWPNQKKILGIKPATDEEKARARKVAGMASRINVVLSLPMIMCMAGRAHGLPF